MIIKFLLQLLFRTIPLWEKINLLQVVIVGIIGGTASTYSAIQNLASESTFVPPCYVPSHEN